MANFPCTCDILGWGWVLKLTLCLDFYFRMYFSGLRVASVGEVVFVCWQSRPSVFPASGLSDTAATSFPFACSEIQWVPLKNPRDFQLHLVLFLFLGLDPLIFQNLLARPFSTGLNGMVLIKL